jgi:ThiF family/Prokaryotic homologs of the JAB domain
MKQILRMTGLQHEKLQKHLFPGDGKEAVAIALCGRYQTDETHIFTMREVHPIAYKDCSVRTPIRISWSTESILPLLEKANRKNWAIVKIHSHPGGFAEFSETDDEADKDLFDSVYGWFEEEFPHASCVMLPTGKMFGRIIKLNGDFKAIKTISVAGDDIHFWHSSSEKTVIPEFAKRHAQAFGSETFNILKKLSVAVIGCSGTGSPVIEQLARLGVGKLVIVDPDCVEEKNLNRILNTTLQDAQNKELKVNVLAKAISKMGTETKVIPIPRNLYSADIVKTVAGCDLLFGCMDSVDGRHLLNKIAVFYNIPYFDLGVKLIADKKGGVDQICGSVHYLQPDQSSLMSRGVYTSAKLSAESLQRTNPAEYKKRLEEKYIEGVQEDRPAVISVNMQLAAMAVNEFLARIHHFRDDGNKDFAQTRISLTQAQFYNEGETEPCKALSRNAGRGDVFPLLDMPELSEPAISYMEAKA